MHQKLSFLQGLRPLGLVFLTGLYAAMLWFLFFENAGIEQPPTSRTIPIEGFVLKERSTDLHLSSDARPIVMAFENLPKLHNFTGPYLSAGHAQAVGDWAAANVYMQWAVESGSPDADLIQYAMVLAAGAGDLDSAKTLAEKHLLSLEKNKDESLSHFVLAVTHFVAGNESLARDHWMKSTKKPISLSADPEKAKREMAKSFLSDAKNILDAGDDDHGPRFLAQLARALDPNGETGQQATTLMGDLHMRAEQSTQALAYFEKSAQGPDADLRIYAHQVQASILGHLKRYEEALIALNPLLKETRKPDLTIATLSQMGEIEMMRKNWGGAIVFYTQALDLLKKSKEQEKHKENLANLYFMRSVALQEAGRWPETEKDLQEALSLAPDNPNVLNQLAYSWADRGENLDKARQMLEDAAQIQPEDYHIIDSLGWVLYRQGVYEEAVRNLEIAALLAPYDDIVGDHLGDAYWRVGRVAEARFQWRRALNYSTNETLKSTLREKLIAGLTDILSKKVINAQTDQVSRP